MINVYSLFFPLYVYPLVSYKFLLIPFSSLLTLDCCFFISKSKDPYNEDEKVLVKSSITIIMLKTGI